MNNHIHDFPKNFKSNESSVRRKNGNAQLSGRSDTVTLTGKSSENHLMSRLRKTEELNVRLEKAIEQSTLKLSDVIATNTKFISIIAHDLRSPFTSILGALELLKSKLDHQESRDVEFYVDIAFSSAIKTLNLLDNLLAWTLTQHGEMCFNPVKINLNELVADEIDSISTLALQKHIMLDHNISPDLNLAGDIQMVRTVFRNLISNAVKYTNAGGKVNIEALENKSFVEISVSDNGVGISYDDKKALFKAGVIRSTAGTDHEKGTGLGLLLCKEFIEMHNGNISVESEPGKGSRFIFTLPHYL